MRKPYPHALLFCLFALILSACSTNTPNDPVGNLPPWAEAMQNSQQELQNVEKLSEEETQELVEDLSSDDLVWADDDFGDGANDQELDAVLSKQNTVSLDWRQSYSQTRAQSRLEQKPIIAWFSHLGSGAPSMLVEQELLNTQDFKDWARDEVLLMKFEFDQDSKEKEKIAYLDKVKKHFGVTSFPQLLILSPEQEVQARYRGYKSGGDRFLWGQLKQGVKIAKRKISKRQDDLERKGFRHSFKHEGHSFFAKIIADQNNTVHFVTPVGKRYEVPIKTLRAQDQADIKSQAQEH